MNTNTKGKITEFFNIQVLNHEKETWESVR